MIEKMHEKSNSLAFKIIFALVSLSFVIGGIGSGFLTADTSAVKVNGKEISQYTFTQAKNRQQSALNAQLGEQFWEMLDNHEYVKQFNQSILNNLIDDELLRQYAKELKLEVSANQIKSAIVNDVNFHQEGKFSNELYQQLLRSNNISADQYASLVYEGMIFSQIQEGIIGSDFPLPVQQELLGKLLMQKRTVRLATYSLAKEIENQTASEAEQHDFFEAHKAEFINPEKLTVEYIKITPNDLVDRVQITQDQINTYYQANKSQYISAEEARIAHIQLPDQTTANEIAQQLKNGADFATLAKEKSTDTLSASKGGDLGWAKAGIFPNAFEEAFKDLPAGQISAPIQIDNVFHIIKVLERKAERTIPVEEAKDQITQAIRTELLATEYSNITREMANKAFETSGSLEAVAEAGGVKVQKTEAFSRDNVPEAINHAKVLKVLFEGDLRQTGQNSEAIDLSNGMQAETIFVRVSDYQAQNQQTFEQAQTAVEKAVKAEKATNELQNQADSTLKVLQAGGASSLTFDAPQTLVFSEAQFSDPILAKQVFAMPKPADNPTYQTMQNTNGDIVVIALDKVEEGDSSKFKALAPQLAQADQIQLRNDLLKNLRERAKIQYNEDFIEQINNDNER